MQLFLQNIDASLAPRNPFAAETIRENSGLEPQQVADVILTGLSNTSCVACVPFAPDGTIRAIKAQCADVEAAINRLVRGRRRVKGLSVRTVSSGQFASSVDLASMAGELGVQAVRFVGLVYTDALTGRVGDMRAPLGQMLELEAGSFLDAKSEQIDIGQLEARLCNCDALLLFQCADMLRDVVVCAQVVWSTRFGVPIVPVRFICGAESLNFDTIHADIEALGTSLDAAARATLVSLGVEIDEVKVAWQQVLRTISRTLDPKATPSVLRAQLQDVTQAVLIAAQA